MQLRDHVDAVCVVVARCAAPRGAEPKRWLRRARARHLARLREDALEAGKVDSLCPASLCPASFCPASLCPARPTSRSSRCSVVAVVAVVAVVGEETLKVKVVHVAPVGVRGDVCERVVLGDL